MGCTYDAAVEVPDGTIRKMELSKCTARRSALPAGMRVWLWWGISPMWNALEEYARLTVLERKCSQAGDVPDPACEYVIPGATTCS